MLLREPGKTDFDLNFSIFGFPVRVHPGFFVLPLLFGAGGGGEGLNAGISLLLLAAVFFVSILVHELGHAFAHRYFGMGSNIVLYWMGGLAIRQSGQRSNPRQASSLGNSGQQVIISLAGPAFGFLLAIALIGLVYAVGGTIVIMKLGGVIPVPIPQLGGTLLGTPAGNYLLVSGVLFNIFINLLNLMPVFPLDGGQVSQQLMWQMDPHNGVKNSIFLSIATCILLVLFALKIGDTFIAIFFGYMAFTNFQMLQQVGGRRW